MATIAYTSDEVLIYKRTDKPAMVDKVVLTDTVPCSKFTTYEKKNKSNLIDEIMANAKLNNTEDDFSVYRNKDQTGLVDKMILNHSYGIFPDQPLIMNCGSLLEKVKHGMEMESLYNRDTGSLPVSQFATQIRDENKKIKKLIYDNKSTNKSPNINELKDLAGSNSSDGSKSETEDEEFDWKEEFLQMFTSEYIKQYYKINNRNPDPDQTTQKIKVTKEFVESATPRKVKGKKNLKKKSSKETLQRITFDCTKEDPDNWNVKLFIMKD